MQKCCSTKRIRNVDNNLIIVDLIKILRQIWKFFECNTRIYMVFKSKRLLNESFQQHLNHENIFNSNFSFIKKNLKVYFVIGEKIVRR